MLLFVVVVCFLFVCCCCCCVVFCLFVVVVVVLGGNKTCRCLHGSRVCKTFQWRERAAGRNRARQTLTVGGRRERKTESVWWRGWGRKSGGNERERVGGLRETE